MTRHCSFDSGATTFSLCPKCAGVRGNRLTASPGHGSIADARAPIGAGAAAATLADCVVPVAKILEGATERVRPLMMTVFAIIGGLLPIMWSAGSGASVMKRIAAPMIGGMVSATLMTLFVVPAIYSLLKRRGWSRAED